MGLLYEETFYVQVSVDGARWDWLRSVPSGAFSRTVTTRDKRIRLGLKAVEYARLVVEEWAKGAGVPEGRRVGYRVWAAKWGREWMIGEGEIDPQA